MPPESNAGAVNAYRSAYLAAGVAMARLTPDGVLIDANPRFAELLGRAVDELPGCKLLDLLHPQDAEAMRAGVLSDFAAGAIHAELRFQAAAGTVWGRAAISIARQPGRAPDELVLTVEDLSSDGALLADRLNRALRVARPAGGRLALLMLATDELAKQVRDQLRPDDVVVRTGGDELGVILAGVGDRASASEIGQRLGAAFGISVFPEDGGDAASLIRQARREMYGGTDGAGMLEVEAGLDASDELGERVAALEPVSLFLTVPDKVLRRIARYMSAQQAAPGEPLAGSTLRIIQDGLCEVRDAEELPLFTLGPGDFMGLESVPVGVRALTECKLLVLDEAGMEAAAPAGSAFREALRLAAEQRDNHLRALLTRPRRVLGQGRTTSIAVYSSKGGSGRTTLALNLAAELGSKHPGEVLLVDLARPYNHVALLAGMSPSTCMARASAAPDERAFGPLLWSAVLPHSAGFMALPSALRPEEAELVTPQLLTRALNVLAGNFKYVVFDLGVALDDVTLAALEVSDQLLLLATPELAAMHDSRQLMDLLTRVLHVPEGRIHVLLNHRSPDSAMSRGDVEKVLRRELLAELRYHGAEPEMATLGGKLQLRANRRSQYARAVADVAARIDGVAALAV